MRSIIESLRAEMAEFRRTSKSQPTHLLLSSQVLPLLNPRRFPWSWKRAPRATQPSERLLAVQPRMCRLSKAKSEIKEILNSICLEIQRLNERLSVMDHRLTVMDQKIDAQNVRIQCVESQLQNADPMVQSPDIRVATKVRPDFFHEGTPLSTPSLVGIQSSNSSPPTVENLTKGSGSPSNDQNGLAR